jgi:hypothetical protein
LPAFRPCDIIGQGKRDDARLRLVTGAATVLVLWKTWTLSRQGHELARQGQELARQSKQADLLSEFNRRYTQVLEMQLKPEHQDDPTLYYDRLWNLQFDQYQSWCHGLLPGKTFAYWMDNRYSDWLADRQVKPMAAVADEPITYRAGFHDIVAKWNHSPFHEFIDDLHELGTAAAIEADKKRRGRG